ncbi:MAG: Ada metal-binding domain-containing protein [Cytophagales bacterium]|nr:Ada metal-binding domain-containing protein [Cytophagales bacterium]
MKDHEALTAAELRQMIRQGEITLGGNKRLKIYGTLACASGKRMHRKNRVFFMSLPEALSQGYRPCGHCFRKEYKIWKLRLQRTTR